MDINCLLQDKGTSTLTRRNYSLRESIELVDAHEEFGSEFLDEALTRSATTQDSTVCLPNPDPILNATSSSRYMVPVNHVVVNGVCPVLKC